MFVSAPPGPRRIETTAWAGLSELTVSGAYHIHTTRSDGHGDRAQVAAAAARAGLKFIILTDHGDGTRPPDAPAYVDGVLVLDGVEISTDNGHYVAIDMPQAPYPLGGSGEAVVEDVRRLGGLGIVAHPDSPKAALRWTSTALPDGVEWLNLDSEWRDETLSRLLRTAAAYVFRPAPALATILNRPATLDARWPALLATRQTLALAGADAHGGVGRRAEDSFRTLSDRIGIPGYEASFRTFSNRVILDRRLSGDAATDARAVYAAIRGGHVFTSIDALAAPALLDFSFESAYSRLPMGSVLEGEADGTLIARALVPPGSIMSIVRNGRVMTSAAGGEVRHVVTGAKGGYRVEIVAPGTTAVPPIPWLVSNAIYFAAGNTETPSGASQDRSSPLDLGGAVARPFPWRVEKDASSSGRLMATDSEAALEYNLAEGERGSQFVALASDLRGQAFNAIDLRLAGDRPLRVSVQLRTADGKRWGRSYYVDPAGSRLNVPVGALRPVGTPGDTPIVSTAATSLLLVIDLTNANPGHSGRLRVRASAFVQ